MWIVLPTKNCKCATCEKTREVIDEAGNPVTGASVTDHGSVGPWIEAEIIEVALTIDHSRCWYFGAVRYALRGQPKSRIQRAEVCTFHDLWMEGWTSFEFRTACEKARKVERRRKGK